MSIRALIWVSVHLLSKMLDFNNAHRSAETFWLLLLLLYIRVHLYSCNFVHVSERFEMIFVMLCARVHARKVWYFSRTPRKEAWDVWCLPPVWNIRAVVWFHFAIASLVLLPSPVTLSVLSFSTCWSFLLNFFRKMFQYFSLRGRLFLYVSCLAARRSKLVGGMCSMLPYGTGICCYAFM